MSAKEWWNPSQAVRYSLSPSPQARTNQTKQKGTQCKQKKKTFVQEDRNTHTYICNAQHTHKKISQKFVVVRSVRGSTHTHEKKMFGATNCVACRKLIYGGPVKVGNSLYHQNCFVCSQCKCKLQVVDFKQNAGQLFCAHCYTVNLRSVNDSANALVARRGGAGAPAPAPAPAPSASGGAAFCPSCGTPASGAKFCV